MGVFRGDSYIKKYNYSIRNYVMITFFVLTIVPTEIMSLNGIMLLGEHLIDLKEYQNQLKNYKNEGIGNLLNLVSNLHKYYKKRFSTFSIAFSVSSYTY